MSFDNLGARGQPTARKRHPIKEIENALKKLEGWVGAFNRRTVSVPPAGASFCAPQNCVMRAATVFFAECRIGALREILAATLANFYEEPRAAW